jgi:ribosome-associated toxin RatA of RatAB toxin-antitoxin module
MAEAKRSETIDVPFDKFFQTVLDFESYPRFVTGVNESSVETVSDTQLKAKLELEMIKKLSYTIDVQHSRTENSAKVSWTLLESDLLTKNNGQWDIVAKGSDQCEVTYSLDVEFKIPVPGLILRGLIKKSLPQAIKEFHQETKRRV